jgi:hypothetical protein
VAQDRDQKWAHVNRKIRIGVSQKGGEFFEMLREYYLFKQFLLQGYTESATIYSGVI